MSRAIVLGANGYIGRHLVAELALRGIEADCFDVQEESLTGHRSYAKLDLLASESLEELNTVVDQIYLFSGLTGTKQGFEQYEKFIDLNEKVLCKLLERMRKQGSKARLIFPSTRLVYKGLPGVALPEHAEKEFKTLYALNKHTAEQLIRQYSEYFGIEYSIVRICVPYGNAIGEGYSYGTVGFLLRQAMNGQDITLYGDGSQRRSFIHISDLSRLIADIGSDSKAKNEILNLGGPDNLSLRQAADLVAEKFGVTVTNRPWPALDELIESGDTVFDSSKAEKMLQIEYKYTFHKWISSLDYS